MNSMKPLLAILEIKDIVLMSGISASLASAAAWAYCKSLEAASKRESQRLERQLRVLQQQLEALYKHHGVPLPPPPPSGLSPEVERLASDPAGKILAIKLYREQNPGVGLAEAKARIDAFCENKS